MMPSASAFRALVVFLCLAGLSGCAGYRVGNISGRDLQGVHSVYVPVAKNASLEPDIEVVVTNDIIRAFETDGTLSVNPSIDADSEFDITIDSVSRSPLRSNSSNILITTEYLLTIHATITFVNRKLGRKIFENASVSGSTTFFTQADINEGERQALPLAAENLGENAVRLVTEGW